MYQIYKMEDNSEVFLENLQELESTTAPFVQRSLALQLYSFNSSSIKWYSIVFPNKLFLSKCSFSIFLVFF